MANYFLALIADFLSIITIASCLVIKVPQIKTILRNQSAHGISVLSLCLELFSYTIMMSYNYSRNYQLLSYMEYPVLLLQEYILIFLVFKYKDLLGKQFQYAAICYAFFCTVIYLKLMPVFVLSFLVPFCTPIGATSKLLQLYEIIKTGDSESVSLTTWALSAFTNLTRIYTIWVDSADKMLLTNFSISFSLSMSVLAAASFYKKPKND